MIKRRHPILLVEDDEVDIESIERALQKMDLLFDLTIARDGVDALNKLYGTPDEPAMPRLPELIILDINMPKMNGTEFLKKIRKDTKFANTNVLVLTSSDYFDDKADMFKLNIAGYMVKPLKIDEFISHCRILL